jgi:acyl-CoA thioester hydrolase
MTEPLRLAHIERIPIRWGDMDAMGHVNNTVYFRYMEQTRISWFDALAPEAEAWGSAGVVIANASCNFRRPLTYPGTVEVRLSIGRIGGSSVPTYYELRVDDDPAVCADGSAVVVFIGMQSQKPVRIPETIRRRLENIRGEG